MHCIKCGNETQDNRGFCDTCLQGMEKYPVKPGTAIQLPVRDAKASARKPARKQHALPPEELALQLRGRIRKLTVAVAILSLVLFVTAAALIHTLTRQETDSNVGQNYTAIRSGQ